jgi:hypothetical protein
MFTRRNRGAETVFLLTQHGAGLEGMTSDFRLARGSKQEGCKVA